MKKKVLLILLVVAISIAAFAGCSADRVYTRNLANMDEVKVAMGDNMVYPTFTKEIKFDVSEEKNKLNELLVLYVPPVSSKDVEAAKGKFDPNAYRYSIKINMDKDFNVNSDPKYKGSIVELYIHGTDYSKLAGKPKEEIGKVEMVSVTERQKKLADDNAKDKQKLDNNGESAYFQCEVVGNVLNYENKMDGQVIRYFVREGKEQSYELTCAIKVDPELKDAAAIKAEYDRLLGKAKAMLDAYVLAMNI